VEQRAIIKYFADEGTQAVDIVERLINYYDKGTMSQREMD
jgi:hypothetical protein